MSRTIRTPAAAATATAAVIAGFALLLAGPTVAAPAWTVPPPAPSPTTPRHSYPPRGAAYEPPVPAWMLPPAAASPGRPWRVQRQGWTVVRPTTGGAR